MPAPNSQPAICLYDGRCSVCVRTSELIARLDRGRGRVRVVDFRTRSEDAERAGLTGAQLEASMHLIHPDGRVSVGPDAVRDTMRLVGLGPGAWILGLPIVGGVFRRAYDAFARRRMRWFGIDGCRDGACAIHTHDTDNATNRTTRPR